MRLLRGAELILHVGDFTSEAALAELRSYAPVEAVHGNMDDEAVRAALPERRVVESEGLRIGLVHDPGPWPGRHERLRDAFPGCGVIAYGHTHFPEVTSSEGVWIVNPGSPTEKRRAPAHTLAVIEGGEPRLVELRA